MMCGLHEPWFRPCLCRNLYRDPPPLGGQLRFKTRLRQPIKVAMKVRDEGCGLKAGIQGDRFIAGTWN